MNINLSQQSYVDYVASMYFNACNVKDVKFTPKTVDVKGEPIVLIHVEGTQTTTGVRVNLDIWPRNHATEDDIKAIPKSIGDIVFRVGYWPEINENGETVLSAGAPKWVSYFNGTKEIEFEGGKREFGE